MTSQRLVVETLRRHAFLLGHGHEMAHQIGDVLGALPQRGQAQRHDVKPIIEILAEQTLVDEPA